MVLQCALAHVKGFDFKGRVDSAFNGQEAIDTFIQNSQEGKNYELILMDCNMPLMDGYTATQEIRAIVEREDYYMPYIIAVTAHSEEKYIKRCHDAGMDFVLPKPARV